METAQKNFIDVTLIEPRLKHLTIFQVFDSLAGGESLTIHNDHDPKPVYYQLLDQRGDIFTWQYLQQGPEWWDILITKRPTQSTAQKNFIDVTLIEPRLKHPTIFQVFDSLAGGESMTIHNDHDPKPVYYQLLGERGDIFTWQYLQQGPEWWDILVTRKSAEDTETVGEIAVKDLRKAEVFKKYGIDFCCGGKKTLKEACEEKNIDLDEVKTELKQVDSEARISNVSYNDWSTDFLADYIINTHHSYVRKYLPEIGAYALKVAKVHGDRHPELIEVQKNVQKINDELIEHLGEEERELFPYIKKIAQARNAGLPLLKETKDLASRIGEYEKEHTLVGEYFENTRKITDNYAIPEDACSSYTLLFKMLQEFEDDLHLHIHLENNILFPKSIDMEKSYQ